MRCFTASTFVLWLVCVAIGCDFVSDNGGATSTDGSSSGADSASACNAVGDACLIAEAPCAAPLQCVPGLSNCWTDDLGYEPAGWGTCALPCSPSEPCAIGECVAGVCVLGEHLAPPVACPVDVYPYNCG